MNVGSADVHCDLCAVVCLTFIHVDLKANELNRHNVLFARYAANEYEVGYILLHRGHSMPHRLRGWPQ